MSFLVRIFDKTLMEIGKISKENSICLLLIVFSGLSILFIGEVNAISNFGFLINFLDFLLYIIFIYFSHKIFFPRSVVNIKLVFKFFMNLFFLCALLVISFSFSDYILQIFSLGINSVEEDKYYFLMFLCLIFPCIVVSRCSVYLPAIIDDSDFKWEDVFVKTKGRVLSLIFVVWLIPFMVEIMMSVIPDDYLISQTLKRLFEYLSVFFCIAMLCQIYKDLKKSEECS